MVQSKKPKKVKDLSPKKLDPKKTETVKGGGKRRTGDEDDVDDLEIQCNK